MVMQTKEKQKMRIKIIKDVLPTPEQVNTYI